VIQDPKHSTADVADVLEYLMGEALGNPDFELRDCMARFERNTGLVVPPELRPAPLTDEPWPLSATPPLYAGDTHNPGTEDMDGAPRVRSESATPPA